MKCREVRERIQEYLEGSLQGKSLYAFEEHLEGCEACRQELAGIRALDARLKEEAPSIWEQMEPSPGFVDRLKKLELEPEKTPQTGFLDLLTNLLVTHRPAVAAGVTICIAIILAFAITSLVSDDDGEPTTVAMAPTSEMAEGGQSMDDNAKMLTGRSAEPGEESPMTFPAPTESDGDMQEMYSFGLESGSLPASIPPPSPTTDTWEDESIAICSGSPPAEDTGAGISMETETAISIVMADRGIQEIIGDRAVRCLEVLSGPALEGYICDGVTVVLYAGEGDPPEISLYACVDPGSETVTSITMLTE